MELNLLNKDDILVSLIDTNGGRKSGDLIKYDGNEGYFHGDGLFHRFTSGNYSETIRAANSQECSSYNSGIRNINDIISVKQNYKFLSKLLKKYDIK